MISTSAPRSSRHAAPARRRSADPRPQATLSPLRLNSYSVSPADLVVSLSLEAVPAAVIRCWTAAAVKAVWALTAARTGTRWRGGKAHGPWPSSQACSYSAGGMSPSGPYSRRLLDQPAHQAPGSAPSRLVIIDSARIIAASWWRVRPRARRTANSRLRSVTERVSALAMPRAARISVSATSAVNMARTWLMSPRSAARAVRYLAEVSSVTWG